MNWVAFILIRFWCYITDVELNEERDEESDSEDDDCAGGMAALSFYTSNADDPYISKDIPGDSDEDEAEIDAQDNVIAVSRVKDDEFCLEAWIYNETQKYIYCHHDYILSNCPIVVEWVGCGRGDSSVGNLVAVGTMSPNIEIWNFDVMNTIDPVLMLAGSKLGKKSPEKKKRKVAADGHTDAVLGLSWNRLQQQVLASASADSCVGVWDLEQSSCVLIKSLHSDKVQAVQWHPYESQMLLSGSYDHYAKLVDCRSPEGSQKSWKLAGEVEKVVWNNHNASSFFASTDTGHVYCYDIRAEAPVFEFKAHPSAVTSLTLSPSIEGCIVTSSEDQSIKVWDVRSDSPKLVDQKKCKIGALFCSAACSDSSLLLCVGGERELRVIDMKINEKVVACFNAQNDEQQDTVDVSHAELQEASTTTAAKPTSSHQTSPSAAASHSSKKLAKKSSHMQRNKKKLRKPRKQ